MKRFCFFSLAVLLLAGCRAYSWRTQVPSSFRKISVPTFRNETTALQAGAIVTRQVLREIQREGTFKISDADDAAVEVQGALLEIQRVAEGSFRTCFSRLRTAHIVLVARISVVDRLSGKVLVDNKVYRAEASYADGQDMTVSRDLAIERAADDLARGIVDDLTRFYWKEEAK